MESPLLNAALRVIDWHRQHDRPALAEAKAGEPADTPADTVAALAEFADGGKPCGKPPTGDASPRR